MWQTRKERPNLSTNNGDMVGLFNYSKAVRL